MSLHQLFALLLRLFNLSPVPDYNAITTLWVQSDSYEPCAESLVKLVKDKQYSEAYQIGFDIAEVATQGFVEEVRKKLAEAGFGPEAAVDQEDVVSQHQLSSAAYLTPRTPTLESS